MIKQIHVHDAYRDWYQVYRAEVVDRIRHLPANSKLTDSDSVVDLTRLKEVMPNA